MIYEKEFPVDKKTRDWLRGHLSAAYSRCYNPAAINYHNYGGRGIRISKDWYDEEKGKLNYRAFFLWAIEKDLRPHLGRDCQLDRIDVNGDYSPTNCRWVTSQENNRNRRDNQRISFNGEERCLKEWAEILGIPYRELHLRIHNYGWSIDRAFTTGLKPHKKFFSLDGKTMSMASWNEQIGANRNSGVVKDRLKSGWSLEKALTTPKGLGGRSRIIEYQGQKKTIKKWAEDSGLKYRTFLHRLHNGWSMEEIMHSPLKGLHDKRVRRKK